MVCSLVVGYLIFGYLIFGYLIFGVVRNVLAICFLVSSFSVLAAIASSVPRSRRSRACASAVNA
jgi:hypothetical protein